MEKKKFITTVDVGYGQNHEIIEAESQEKADAIVYEMAREEFESNANYGAEPYTKELAVDLGLEDEEEEAK